VTVEKGYIIPLDFFGQKELKDSGKKGVKMVLTKDKESFQRM